MPISSVTNRVEYQGNGSSALFSFPYQFHAQSDLAVFSYNSSATAIGDIIKPFVLNAAGPFGYTVSGTANASGIYPSGANIVLNSSPNVATVMVIFRSSIVTNSFNVGQNGIIPSTGLNNQVDYLTLINQRLQDQVTRSVRLPDGYYGTFDPTIPADLAKKSGKSLVVNSTASGWVLTDPLAATYIANTLIYADANASATSLGGSAAGNILVSNGSSAPSWGSISIGSGTVSAGSITGILANTNGGTGTGDNFTQYGVVVASSATQLSQTLAGGGDVPLLGNAGSVPTFRALPLSSGSSVTGTLATGNGGTGSAGPYLQYGLIFANTPTQFGTVASATAGTVLTANGSSAPTFQAIPAVNLTTNGSGVLPIVNGGTNRNTMTAGSILFGSGTTQVGLAVAGVNQVVLGGGSSGPITVVGYGSSAHVLTSTGDGTAPTWLPASSTPGPTAPTVVTATYSATTSDATIIANSTNYTVRLFTAVGNAGREIVVQRGTTTNSSFVVVAGTSAQTIGGVSSISLPRTQDFMVLYSDNANWQIKGSRITSAGHFQSTNGYGSGNTRIRKYSNEIYNIGNCMTFANSATDGLSATINLAGVYSFSYTELFNGLEVGGLTLNAAGELSTDVTSVTAANVLAMGTTPAADQMACISWTGKLDAGDVVRPHTRATTDASVPGRGHFFAHRIN